MKSTLILSTLLVFSITTEFAFARTYCVSLPPDLESNKPGILYGIPMTGQRMTPLSRPPVKYIIPMDRFIPDYTKFAGDRIIPMGMVPPKNFRLHFVPLRSFLEQNTLPGYVKLLLVDPMKKCL